jgi:hypothetical protein
MSGTEFDPDRESGTGKDRVVALVLPDEAESTKASFDHDRTFDYFTSLKSISGRNIKSIGSQAFYHNIEALTTVDFPAATSIGERAFSHCFALTTMNFPLVTSIGQEAFNACHALTTVYFPEVTSIGQGAFSLCAKLSTVNFPKTISLGASAFAGCEALTTVDFPAAISIDEVAFWNCRALTTMNFPEATSIGRKAFIDCHALTTVNLPKAASIGGDYVFAYCALTTVNLPSATSIGWAAFYHTGGIIGAESLMPLTVILPKAAPTLPEKYGEESHAYTYATTVTIKRPTDSTGYDEAWQEAFKAGFGNNATITLRFEDL